MSASLRPRAMPPMSSSSRWAWTVSLVAATAAALVLAFVLSFSSQGGGFYERNFVWLFWPTSGQARTPDR